MRRRHFLAALGSAALSHRFASAAQGVPPRIGFLAGGAAASINSAHQIRIIKQGLADNGLIEGRDYAYEPRFIAGRRDQLPAMVRDLAAAGVRVIIADAVASVRTAQQLAPRVPIVMVCIDDPVGNGLIGSLAKPGGHVTGLATENAQLTPRLLDLTRAVLPPARSLALLYNPANPPTTAFLNDLRQRAGALSIAVTEVEFQSRDELEKAFERMATKPPDAVHVMVDPGTDDFIDRIPVLALMHRLPTFGNAPEFATYGGLIAYGASREQLYLRAGYFVKKILDGANPGELAVEQPQKTELWINLGTARVLNLPVPDALRAAADKVLE